jgi:hypothetical protein
VSGQGETPPPQAPAGSPAREPGEVPESRLARWSLLLPVIGAPIGLLVAILASLMISGWRVTHSAIVQVERAWLPGEPVALRVHALDGDGAGIAGAKVTARVRRGDEVVELGELADATGAGTAQARVQAPAWAPGPAALELDIAGAGRSFRETVDVELVAARSAKRGTLTISTSVKNWADDTEPQPEKLRIALRPLGRLCAGFDNALLVRVTDPEGKPHVGPVEVRLLDGEFGPHRGGGAAPPVLFAGSTDPQGLLRFDGQLSTDVVRFEVRVPAPVVTEVAAGTGPEGQVGKDMAAGTGAKGQAGKDAKAGADAAGKDAKPGAGAADGKGAKPGAADANGKGGADAAAAGAAAPAAEPAMLGTRRFRLVSFAGAVKVTAEPLAVRPGELLAIKARGLRARKAVYVDVHGPDGAWIDALPPVLGPEPPREWAVGAARPGFLQIEAYQYTTAPGESAALARVQVVDGATDADASLVPLLAQQRAVLDVGRVEKGFDRVLEQKYLDAVEAAEVAAADVPLARAWLLGTLPVEVLGPPTALATLVREQEAVVARKQTWAFRIKWFLLAGGGLFLAVTMLLVVISHRRAAATLTREIHGKDASDEIAREIAQAQRAVLLRAVALVVTMALGLVLTVVVLDKLLWQV